MATVDITRSEGRTTKRGISVFSTTIDVAEAATSADVYQVLVLPAESQVLRASVQIMTANDAATSAIADLGFDGGDELINDVDLTAAADTFVENTGSAVPTIKETGGTVTYTPTYTGALTAGKVLVTIEYNEYEKKTGELTNFAS